MFLNGQPVPGIEVAIDCHYDPKPLISESQISDSNGIVRFAAIPDGEYFFMTKKTNQYAYYDGDENGIYASVPGIVPDIELSELVPVSTTVTLNSYPQSGVHVYLRRVSSYLSSFVDEAYTDAQGNVTFNIDSTDEKYYFEVKKTDEFIAYNGNTLGKTFMLNTEVPNIELDPGNTVKTRLTFNGVSLSGKEVHLKELGNRLVAKAVSDANGNVIFRAIPSEILRPYYFVVEADESDPFANYNGSMLKENQFRIPGTISNIELENANTITTRVVLNGNPVADAYVSIVAIDPADYLNTSGRTFTQAKSDSNGIVTFKNLPSFEKAYFVVRRSAGEYANYDGLELMQFFSVPGTIPDISLEVGNTVTTKVTMNGTPLSNVQVSLMDGLSAETDSSGNATFTNIENQKDVYFTVMREEGKFTFYNGKIQGNTFDIPSPIYPNIDLIEGETIKAKFTCDGKPAVNYYIELYKIVDPYNVLSDIDVGRFSTDDNGEIVMTNIAPGDDYYFNVYLPSLGSAIYGSDEYRFSVPGVIKAIELNAPKPDNNGNVDGGNNSNNDVSEDSGSSTYYDSTASNILDKIVRMPIELTVSAAKNAVTEVIALAGQNSNKITTVKFKNIGYISFDVFDKILNTAGSTSIKLVSDSIMGNAVDVRITIDPQKAVKSINLFASTKSEHAAYIKSIFGKHFKNDVYVISLVQQGDFGTTVEIAAKIDFESDIGNLYFYSYDSKTNIYRQITAPSCWIDQNGYIHFITMLANNIIISNGPLELKGFHSP